MNEVSFWLTDPRIISLGPCAKLLFHYLWLIAVKERRECLPTHWGTQALHRCTALDTRTLQRCIKALQEKCLIEVGDTGQITVCDVASKHPNMNWHSNTINPNKAVPKSRVEQSRIEREEQEHAAPPQTSKKARAKTPLSGQMDWILRAWSERFPWPVNGNGPLGFPAAGKIRAFCKRKGVSVAWFLSKLPQDHPNPWKLACFYLNSDSKQGVALPGMSDPEAHEQTFVKWEEEVSGSSNDGST